MSISSQRYSIVEPHPSIPSSSYFSTGRGGAGNVTKASTSTTRSSDASGPAARVPLSKLTAPATSRKNFTGGRGGAGNVYPSSERTIFSFDEELERQLGQERHAAPVYHVGRGGAGNICGSEAKHVYLDSAVRRRSEDSGRSASSASSTSSAESGADYVNRNIKKGLQKMMGVGDYMQR